MECDAAMKLSRFLNAIALGLVLLLPSVATLAATSSMVLVASRNSPLTTLSARDIRRSFLGSPIQSEGATIVPLRNLTAAIVYEDFLQHVLFMTETNYQRFLRNINYRDGTRVPDSVTVPALLLSRLSSNPLAITFMSREEAEKQPTLKILAEL
jgi:hypothetical protein